MSRICEAWYDCWRRNSESKYVLKMRKRVVVLRSRWAMAAKYKEFVKAGERRVRIGLVCWVVASLVVGFEEAVRTAILLCW